MRSRGPERAVGLHSPAMLAAALMLVVAQAPHLVTLMEGGWVAADVDAKQLTL